MQNLEFSNMSLSPEMLQSLAQMGYTKPTPIQAEVVTHLLKQETLDLVALAQTGSGKTAAFGIPLLEKIDGSLNQVQGLVLAPTRELAAQIEEILSKLMKPLGLRSMTIYGGQSYSIQRDNIRRKPHVLIATPGRLIDLLNQKLVDVTQLKVLVLDEADRMLSMGFEEDLQAILNFTHRKDQAGEDQDRANCQTWLFSATMAPGIKRILNRYLKNPKIVEQVSANQGVSTTLTHHYVAIRSGFRKQALLRIIKSVDNFYGIIFCQTKRDVSDVEELLRNNDITCMSLHGDKQQRERESILKNLKSEKFSILIATDVAARGLDVKNLSHVIHYSLPIEVESYIHRSGRTGRNGENGLVISLMEPSDFSKLSRIQRLTKIQFTAYPMKNTGEVLKGIVKSELETLSRNKGDSHIMQELKKICGELLTEQESNLYSTAEWMAAVINSKMRDQSIWRDDIYISDFGTKAPRSGGGGDRRGGDRGDYRSDRRGPPARRSGGGGGYGAPSSSRRRDDDSGYQARGEGRSEDRGGRYESRGRDDRGSERSDRPARSEDSRGGYGAPRAAAGKSKPRTFAKKKSY